MRPSPKRKKNKNFCTFSTALGDALKNMGLTKKMRQYQVCEIWEDIVGPQIAQNSQPAKWQGNTLVIKVKHASWMQELSFLQSTLLEKIKLAVPGINIKDIRFQVGEIRHLENT
ncbi:MAG: DUF721 domain-containing protein [Pseudomonadota bacterium]